MYGTCSNAEVLVLNTTNNLTKQKNIQLDPINHPITHKDEQCNCYAAGAGRATNIAENAERKKDGGNP